MPYEFHFELVMQSLDRLLWGAALTIRLSALAMVLGLAVGVCAAVILKNGPAYARALVRAYVEVIRSTPFLVQLFIIYFGLPSLGLQLDANGAALVAMTVNLGAYAAEIVRAGNPANLPMRYPLAIWRHWARAWHAHTCNSATLKPMRACWPTACAWTRPELMLATPARATCP